MSLRALFAPPTPTTPPPQGEGLEVKVQGQLAEWPQKPRPPLSTSDPSFLTGAQATTGRSVCSVFVHIDINRVRFHVEKKPLVRFTNRTGAVWSALSGLDFMF